jgi:outer membrane protein assembly factor BamB
MIAQGRRQRAGRVTYWVIGGLLTAFGLLVALHLYRTTRFESDAELMARLAKAALPDPATDPSQVGQWPQWRGPNRDGVSAETGWLTEWPAKGPRVLWKKEAGDGYSSLAVAGGRVYTMLRDGDAEAVVCRDADTGKQLWRFSYPGKYGQEGRTFEEGYGSGPRSTPTVDGDHVYTVGATGILHCLRADTGKKVWQHDLIAEFKPPKNLQWGVSFSPLVEGGLVFTNPGGKSGESLVAFDKRTGEVVWKNLDDPAGYSSPIAMTVEGVPQVIFFTGAGLVSVDPKTGGLHWRYPWETQFGCNIATPIAAGNYLFISSNYGKGCAVLEVSKDGGGKLQARRVYEGTQMSNHFSSSVRYQDHVYGFNDGVLTCLDFRTGETVWREKGFKKGSLLIADGHLIVLGENGKLAVARATPDGFQAKSSFQVSRKKCWTAPVLAGGRLYVRDETHVICLDLKKPPSV